MLKFLLPLAISVALSPASGAVADTRDKTVKFEAGANAAHYRDTIHGYDAVNYYLDARAGQSMSIDFEKSRNSCYFNVLSPVEGETIHMGSAGEDAFDGILKESGKYRVVVYLMRASARRGASCKFSIGFEITN